MVVLVATLALAAARDAGKLVKTSPTITNSLVNLGKMEISLYFGKPSAEDVSIKQPSLLNLPHIMPINKPQLVEEPCPCVEFRSKSDPILHQHSELIKKILSSNNLFRNPTSSLCCDSHEQFHESTFVLEMSPNFNPKTPIRIPPFPINRFKPGAVRPKAVEILFFPKRKDLSNLDFTKLTQIKETLPKDGIKMVGKELTPNKPNEGASVKKDLAITEAKDKKELENNESTTAETNVANNNAL